MTVQQTPTVTPTPPPAVPAALPEPTPAEAALRRALQVVVGAVVVLALLFAGYVLIEHPRAVPALQGVGSIVAIGLGVIAVVKLVKRP